MVKVSVIVPVYNAEPFLEKCLNSLVTQTLEEIEILVVNDSSPDDCQRIIDDFQARYPEKIKAFLKPNGGIASVRNFGIERAQGEYFGFLDSDDYVEPDMFETLYTAAKKEEAVYAVSNFYFTYSDHEESFKEGPYHNSKEMMMNLHATLWNKIYKTSFIRELDLTFIEGYRYEDASFLLKLAPHLQRFIFIDKPFLHYVQREGSSMASHNHKVKEIVYIFEDIYDYYRKQGWFDEYRKELEYLSVRFFLGQPFRSAVRIKDKEDRKKTLAMLFDTLQREFPSWHKNEYLKSGKGLKNLYFKTVNRFTFPIYSWIFGCMR